MLVCWSNYHMTRNSQSISQSYRLQVASYYFLVRCRIWD